ncbi:MAG TPA: septal ring lytic transglycosylase RlpA family protein [Spirochaetota bacterium]|nr:septal ring lytic transglycosylase RlpA family protein [Spirochaetota bacterium]HOD13474.1 septal ring lytic transglycosylase RlpA family protein [Spirochaetota bacterium]HPG51531.1 septal ring lytic transglycosylase RlpA family protein [Spirochaetota bacterium]HPN11684.1 septal ring lytic transglycosylase RlpA family protein [Spirochaetota bacterium]
MQSIIKSSACITAILAAFMFFLGCTPENANLKKSDYRTVRSDDSRNDSGYDEEDNDFSEDADDRAVSAKETEPDEVDAESNGDTSYTKDKYYQTGAASWYGREFDGKKTASGERFDMNELTAAHKTLPFGTIVSVKNFETGKTVRVRINDRGPFRAKRILDVSYAAAKKLGMLKQGEAKVGLVIVKKGNRDEDYDKDRDNDLEAVSGDSADYDSADSGSYAVQAGAFYSKRNADTLKERIEQMTGNDVVVVHDGDMYKVRIEGLNTKKDVSRIKKALSEEDIPSYVINKNE